MAPIIEFDTKERVREATDIVDLISGYLDLRREGRGFSAICPWHDDSHPSLKINPDRQTWKCWVCNIGGDVFSFVQQREGIGFGEALRMLAEKAGIPLGDPRQAHKAAQVRDEKQAIYQVMAGPSRCSIVTCLKPHKLVLRGSTSKAAISRRRASRRGILATRQMNGHG